MFRGLRGASTRQVRGRVFPLFGRTTLGAGGTEAPAPILSNPNAGTANGTGTTNALVDTTSVTGRLYWVVVTNGGSCTDLQLIAGSGGNIVAGVAGNQVVNTTGTQTVAVITGLSALTTYQIIFLQLNGGSKFSNQSSVTLITLA